MSQPVTKLYFTITLKDGTEEKYECRGFEEKPDRYELILDSGKPLSFKKDEIKNCICTGFEPFWAD